MPGAGQKIPLHQLDPDQARTPDWSPDDHWIEFESSRGCVDGNQYALFIESVCGGNPVQLTPCRLNANHGTWSPDQNQIAFSYVFPYRRGGKTQMGRGIAALKVPAYARFNPEFPTACLTNPN